MSYDVLTESVRLLEGAASADVARLSRRARHLPLAVDRDGDVAATMFLRRGVSGAALLEVHVLARTSAVWRVLGSGGGPGDGALELRPRITDLGGPAISSGGGGVRWSGSGRLLWRSTWISYAELRVAQEVPVLRVGTRRVPVAGHGCAVVLWRGRPPRVTALDAAGTALGPVPLDAGLPRRF